jgi:TonB family protein
VSAVLSMRAVPVALVLAFSGIAAMAICCKPQAAPQRKLPPVAPVVALQNSPDELREWNQLLKANLVHLPGDRAFVRKAVSGGRGRWSAALASMLLEEWDAVGSTLEHPRPVLPMQGPRIGQGPLRIRSAQVVVEAVVGADGLVTGTTLHQSCGDAGIDAQVEEQVKGMAFRPASRNGTYTSDTYISILRIDFGS